MDAEGGVTTREYSEEGWLAKLTDANGNATFAMTIPPGLTWKDHYFAQAMILDGSNQAVALSLPIAFRAERH